MGGYRVEGVLGAGGMGLVYRGVQPDIGKRVAIKVIQPDQALGDGARENLLAEARAANAVHHRGIVDIFAFGQLDDGRHYLVMEELEGETLAHALRRGPLSIPVAINYFDQVLEALAAAHKAGVIHRDMKPSNLFIVQPPHGDRYMKVLDFGLAKRLPPVTDSGRRVTAAVSTFVGTPSYLAPEQALGERVGPQTDLYGLGCVLFEALAGKPPFHGSTFVEVIELHLHSPAPSLAAELPGVPQALDELVARMLRKSRKDRPETAEEVRECLARAAIEFHEQATRARVHMNTTELRVDDSASDPLTDRLSEAPTVHLAPLGAFGRNRDRRGRRNRRVGMTAALAAVALGGLVWAFLSRPESETETVVDARRPDSVQPPVQPPVQAPVQVAPAVSSAPATPVEPTRREPAAPERQVEKAAPSPVPTPSPAEDPVPLPRPAPARPPPPRVAPAPPSRPPRAPDARASSAAAQGTLLAEIDDNLEWAKAMQSQGRLADPMALGLLAAVKEQARQAKDPELVRQAATDLRDWKKRYRPDRAGPPARKAR